MTGMYSARWTLAFATCSGVPVVSVSSAIRVESPYRPAGSRLHGRRHQPRWRFVTISLVRGSGCIMTMFSLALAMWLDWSWYSAV